MRLERQTLVAVLENVNTDRHLDTKLKPSDPIGPVVRYLLSVMESLILQYVVFRFRADQHDDRNRRCGTLHVRTASLFM